MFKSQQSIIIFMTLFMMSCTSPTQKSVPSEDTKPDLFLEHIDSVLSYADNEIENIAHIYEESEKEHYILVNEIKRLNREILNRNIVIEEITTDYNDLTDSLITIIGIQKNIVTQKEYIIKNLENKLHYLNSQMTEQVVQYESIVYRLEDSLLVLNSYIEELNNLQRRDSLENKKRNRN